jgi:hypothetical protein
MIELDWFYNIVEEIDTGKPKALRLIMVTFFKLTARINLNYWH